MKIQIIRYPQANYACIKHATGEFSRILDPNLTVAQSLKASAAELRRQAERLQRRAQILDEAALMEERGQVGTPDAKAPAEAQHAFA